MKACPKCGGPMSGQAAMCIVCSRKSRAVVFSPEQMAGIARRFKNGATLPVIASEFGCAASTVRLRVLEAGLHRSPGRYADEVPRCWDCEIQLDTCDPWVRELEESFDCCGFEGHRCGFCVAQMKGVDLRVYVDSSLHYLLV